MKNNELLFEREFTAPIDLVFETWTNANHLEKWWGPDGFTLTTESFDLREGGYWKFVMHGPDRDYPNKIIYTQIRRPDLIAYHHSDEPGTEGVGFAVEVNLHESNGKTTVSMRMTFASEEVLKHVVETYGAIEGAKQTLSRLGLLLESIQQRG